MSVVYLITTDRQYLLSCLIGNRLLSLYWIFSILKHHHALCILIKHFLLFDEPVIKGAQYVTVSIYDIQQVYKNVRKCFI